MRKISDEGWPADFWHYDRDGNPMGRVGPVEPHTTALRSGKAFWSLERVTGLL